MCDGAAAMADSLIDAPGEPVHFAEIGLVKRHVRREPGCPADFLVLQGSDWRELVYMLGVNPVSEVWIGGKKVVG